MRILIANDDGIDAPGIALAEKAARKLSDDVWIVAPEAKRTAAGSSLTVGRPLMMTETGAQKFSCSGTPADCIVTAMTWLFKDGQKPDLVLSGVNDGPNVAEDIAYSGTLGIAREATFWDIPAIGMSRVKKPDLAPEDAEFLTRLIAQLWDKRQDWVLDGHWLSINLPAALPAPVRQAKIGRDKIASTSDVVSTNGARTELIVPRGREGGGQDGDENDLLGQGAATLTRLSWLGHTDVSDGLIAGLPDK
ncbi:5'/3'-nucleotidase SurE [Oceaniglobus ichthyenteri]|uniref:5'/3'-nucleotidase SurE n=1 Tax=Oceaniglobus ichthyenteri TaxID=2136177 RepID=UPI000D398185|nr:5'/3'-nucleotidase SurE [Oceaniglobus ichthyenteri]